MAASCGGHYMDQFTYAERATDWRGNNNIAESMFSRWRCEPHPVPRWIVVGAGTGGTSATIGRYIRYQRLATQLCVVDPERSVFFDYFVGDAGVMWPAPARASRASAGRAWSPASCRRWSTACCGARRGFGGRHALVLSQPAGPRVGPSTGTNFVAAVRRR
jgi:cysteine synthase A